MTFAVKMTAPTPVLTAHPMRAALSNGTRGSMDTQPRSGTTAYWEKEETPLKCRTRRPSLWKRMIPLPSVPSE